MLLFESKGLWLVLCCFFLNFVLLVLSFGDANFSFLFAVRVFYVVIDIPSVHHQMFRLDFWMATAWPGFEIFC